MEKINRKTLFNIVQMFADSEVCALASSICNDYADIEIENYAEKAENGIDIGIHCTIWVKGKPEKSYYMTACGIAFRENGIRVSMSGNRIDFCDTEKDQFFDISFMEENSYEN